LIEVLKATPVPKSKGTSSIKVDVKLAANILLLTGLIKEQASIDNARRITFEPGCRTVTWLLSCGSLPLLNQWMTSWNTLLSLLLMTSQHKRGKTKPLINHPTCQWCQNTPLKTPHPPPLLTTPLTPNIGLL
ncbi:hypothetical protein DFH28DRAFT_901964, partial [Melampsora americana]